MVQHRGSPFYGMARGNHDEVARGGTIESGVTVTAASWSGGVVTRAYHEGGVDKFEVRQVVWKNGEGINELVAEGVIGQAKETI